MAADTSASCFSREASRRWPQRLASWTSKRSNANDRDCPGAIRRAISAASSGIVPLPHMGSSSTSLEVHPASRSKPAARFSRNGASTDTTRCPRLKSGSPDVSR